MERKQIKKGFPYPLGATVIGRTINFSMIDKTMDESGVILYHRGTLDEAMRIPFDKTNRMGNISSLVIENIDAELYDYNFFVGKKEMVDPYAKRIVGNEVWGIDKRPIKLRSGLLCKKFNWQNTEPLKIPYADSIFYCMHVRGFTKHPSSKVKHKGTFLGIKEKLSYLKALGITAIELMPAYEFNEKGEDKAPLTMEYAIAHLADKIGEDCVEQKLNYWGYQDAYYFAPKASFAAGDDPVSEFKLLIRECHKHGIEVLMQFYFPQESKQSYILDVIKYWVMEYKIDGVHVKGSNIPVTLLATEPILATTKIMHEDFKLHEIYSERETPGFINLAYYRDDFMYDMRRYLKSDMDMLPSVQFHMKNHPRNASCINYISNYYGFTLADLVSYERKHNEANGEDNRDGTDYNYSWNCGFEGDTRKKTILSLRKKQVRNAMAFVLLAQGTPLLLAGDEFLNSQMGNNNPYCQDNEITWVEWKNTKAAKEMSQYIRYLIRLRKEHPVLHREEELHMLDTIGCGYPDLSYHGEEAWRVHLENYNRHIAMMYCGKYIKKENKEADFIYIALNMHWEEQKFALPKLPEKMEWELILDTASDRYNENTLLQLDDKRLITLMGRSVCVLKSCKMKQDKKESVK